MYEASQRMRKLCCVSGGRLRYCDRSTSPTINQLVLGSCGIRDDVLTSGYTWSPPTSPQPITPNVTYVTFIFGQEINLYLQNVLKRHDIVTVFLHMGTGCLFAIITSLL